MKYLLCILFSFSVSIGFSQTPANLQAIDLGLQSGTKWANMNLGATNISDYGDYYSWAETYPKEKYSLSTYKWSDTWTIKDSTYVDKDGFTITIEGKTYSGYTKYVSNADDGYKGFCDNKVKLDLEDDAAYTSWGKHWQIPSIDQLDELKTNCTWIWSTLNGINGYKVIGPNGNYIFLPAAGYKENDNKYHEGSEFRVGEWGSYLSNQAYYPWTDYAQDLYFSSEKIKDVTGTLDDFFNGHYNGCRYQGHSIRPIYIDDSDININKCSKPTISYVNGKLVFSSQTDDVHFVSTISSRDCVTSVVSESIDLDGVYDISVYASKQGYENSDVAEATLIWTNGCIKDESITEINENSMQNSPIFVIQNGNFLCIKSSKSLVSVDLYSSNGIRLKSIKTNDNELNIDISENVGNLVILQVNGHNAKIILKR